MGSSDDRRRFRRREDRAFEAALFGSREGFDGGPLGGEADGDDGEDWNGLFSAAAPAAAPGLAAEGWEELLDYGEENGRRPPGLAAELARLLARRDGRARIFDRLRALRGSDPRLRGTADAATLTFIATRLQGDDRWLADTIARHGPETHWTAAQHRERHNRATARTWPAEPGHIEGILLPPGVAHGTTVPAHAVRAFYFPGTTNQRALVIGGVHGSETAAADTALALVAQLRGHTPYFTTIVIPELFAANVAAGRRLETTTGRASGDSSNRVTAGQADPNRQFPPLGQAFDPASPLDAFGATIEPENQVLLELIQRYLPSRVASLHEIHSSRSAGIFADTRTDGHTSASATKTLRRGRTSATVRMGGMLEYESTVQDWALAICMAERAHRDGATVLGNKLGTVDENASYGSSAFPARGTRPDKPSAVDGVSGGNWGSEAVLGSGAGHRGSITWITVEIQQRWRTTRTPAQLRSGRMPYPLDPRLDADRIRELAAFRNAVKDVFLANSTCPRTKRAAWATSGLRPR